MYFIFGLGAFQTFVFSILLFFKRGEKQADKFLSAFFLVITVYLLYMFSIQYQIWERFPSIFLVYSFVFLSFGPLLFLYVTSIIGNELTARQILVHAIPIVTVLLILSPVLFMDRDVKILCFIDKFKNLPLNISIGTFLQCLSSPIYFIWILIRLRKHSRCLKEKLSSVNKNNLDWMYKLVIGGIIIWFIECLNLIGLNFTDIEFLVTYNTSWYIKVAFMIFVIFIGFYGVNQGDMFSKTLISGGEEKVKLVPSLVAKKYRDDLVRFMQDERLYLDSELRIQDISIKLDLPVHILSYTINTELNQNFYDFVNSYRVEEVKKRLHGQEFKKLTIIAIAFDCGFNSKATFNRLFKKYTGQTPSQFKKEVSIEKSDT